MHQLLRHLLQLGRPILPPPLQEVHLVPHKAPAGLRVVREVSGHSVQDPRDVHPREVLRGLEPSDISVGVRKQEEPDRLVICCCGRRARRGHGGGGGGGGGGEQAEPVGAHHR